MENILEYRKGQYTCEVVASNDKSVTEIVIPERYDGKRVVSIGEGAFSDCRYLTSITMPDTITVIGAHAFQCCECLKNVTLSKNLKKIEYLAFDGCYSLENIELPFSIEKIDYMAFSECIGLKEIIIPLNTVMIGQQAFADCKQLKSVIFRNDGWFLINNDTGEEKHFDVSDANYMAEFLKNCDEAYWLLR